MVCALSYMHARAAAVLREELDAGLLEGSTAVNDDDSRLGFGRVGIRTPTRSAPFGRIFFMNNCS